tara:strand:+ start:1236 stop:1772 length:537 start_codon:yes stop_codon:yes gene_type:complete
MRPQLDVWSHATPDEERIGRAVAPTVLRKRWPLGENMDPIESMFGPERQPRARLEEAQPEEERDQASDLDQLERPTDERLSERIGRVSEHQIPTVRDLVSEEVGDQVDGGIGLDVDAEELASPAGRPDSLHPCASAAGRLEHPSGEGELWEQADQIAGKRRWRQIPIGGSTLAERPRS